MSQIVGHVALQIRLIGQMSARTVREDSVLPTGRKTRAMLALIALAAPRPVLRSRIAELLWSMRSEEQSRASLRQELHVLLDTLGAVKDCVIDVTRDHITLKPHAVWVDANEVMRATPRNPGALDLFDGTLLERFDEIDPAFDIWLGGARERLQARALDVAVAVLQRQDDPAGVVTWAERVLRIDCAHEGALRALMRARADRGESELALQAYEECRCALAERLDTVPSEETMRLVARIRSAAPIPIPDPPQVLPPMVRAHPLRTRLHLGVQPLRCVGVPEADPGFGFELADAMARALGLSDVLAPVVAGSREGDGAPNVDHIGLDAVLDGTLQRIGHHLRVSIQLIDLRDRSQVTWAQRFDLEATDLLSARDEIATIVIAQIEREVMVVEASRIARTPGRSITPYRLMMQAMPLVWQMDRDGVTKGGDCLARALAMAPHYMPAVIIFAFWHIVVYGQGWAPDVPAVIARATELGDLGIKLAPSSARANSIAGHVRAYLRGELAEASALHRRALRLNPNLAMSWMLSAATLAYRGEVEEALRRAERYKLLSPMDPQGFYYDGIKMMVHLQARDYGGAVAIGRTVTAVNPFFVAGYKPYLAALGHLGLHGEAEEVLQRLLALEPGFKTERFLASYPLERPGDREHYADGLRLAGAP